MPAKSKGTCWFLVTHYKCPVCGCSAKDSIKQTTPKPNNPRDRIKYVSSYCGCAS